jgi:hypothetical protein
MLLALVGSVANSLMFGSPDMQVTGNGSYAHKLHWYQDSISSQLPQTTVVSLPMWSYQVLMLLWSVWLSMSLFRWLKWGWGHYIEHGIWKASPKTAKASKQKTDNLNKQEK